MSASITENIAQVPDTQEANDGPSDAEVIQYATEITAQLQDDKMVATFTENTKQVGVWVNKVDADLDRITRKFQSIVQKQGKDFPGLSDFNDQWKGYHTRWTTHVHLSRDVASEHVSILRRFDQVFLAMVEEIKTDQDRLDAITELQSFIDEKHDRSAEMHVGFQILKHDIEGFIARLDAWIKRQGVELKMEVDRLKADIDRIQDEISVLDKKIRDATIALTVTGACLLIIGAVVAGSVLAKYKSDRADKLNELRRKQDELDDLISHSQELANSRGDIASLMCDFTRVKPDIVLICEKLAMFGEIWSAVRTQSVRFQEHLKSGHGVETNLRFKKEVRLARAMCIPLIIGLEKYASELENGSKS